ncbi:glycosyltransferase [Moheibacter sediminis]|uniref:Glycosyltransferase involved in cell wall bisynthesis n=1 Tax=Moheibacter sediminis TaxID=1434700 RepID=A0A1W1YGL0_9FLAO|nr:glycosyltransferase [Moheibacter sediminis]SMC35305.1 Glycosyltransferase involved in cell wall bisynthesis [Moheibacter sediminis]
MQRKNILFVSSWYPSRVYPFNGDFVQRHALAASLLNEISVLHAIKDENLNQNYEIEIKEGKIKEGKIKEVIVYYKNSRFRPWNYIRRLIALKKGFKHISNFDLVHLNVSHPAGIFVLYLKIIKGKKYVITEHWTGFRKDLFQKVNFLERILIKLILKNASKLLPVSTDLGKSMLNASGNKPVEVIPNVVFTEFFKPLEKNNPIKKFLHLSSLKYDHKNIRGMLNVAKKLADEGLEFEFHLGGTGSREDMHQFIQKNNLEKHIFTFGELSHDKVPDKMNDYDTFVLFSNYENQPCVQAESFASGLSFIGTDVGGIKEFLPESFGFLIEKGNEQQLYEAMKKTIQGKKFASKEEMSAYADSVFSPQVIAKRFDKVYKEILNG